MLNFDKRRRSVRFSGVREKGDVCLKYYTGYNASHLETKIYFKYSIIWVKSRKDCSHSAQKSL